MLQHHKGLFGVGLLGFFFQNYTCKYVVSLFTLFCLKMLADFLFFSIFFQWWNKDRANCKKKLKNGHSFSVLMSDKQTGRLMEHRRLKSSIQVLHHIGFFNLTTTALCIDLIFQVSGTINKQWEKTTVDGTVPFSMLGIYCYLWDLQAISFPLKFYINVFLFLITLACICWRKPWCRKVPPSGKNQLEETWVSSSNSSYQNLFEQRCCFHYIPIQSDRYEALAMTDKA